MEILSLTGQIGSSIIISGNGMNYVDRVFFNGAAAIFQTLSEQFLSADVPSDASFGKVRVESSFLDATGYSDSDFIPLPVISFFTPSSGLFFDFINVSGLCLSGVTGLRLGDFNCSFSISGNNSIFFQVPSGATKDKIRLLTYSGLEVSSSVDFDPSVIITGFEYEKAFPGLPIVIKGKYFDEHLLYGLQESIEYKVSLANTEEGLRYHIFSEGGSPVANFSGDLLKDSTYIFDFIGIPSGGHFYFTQNAQISGEVFDMTSLTSGVSGFGSVIERDGYLYLLPEKFGKVVKLNSSGLFDSGKFEVLDLNSNYSGLSGFGGGFQYNNSGFLIPNSDGRMIRFGLGSQFGTGTIEALDLNSFESGLSGFNGGFYNFGHGYLAPYIHGKFTRVDLDLFKTGVSGFTGIKFIDLTLIDPELTGFAGAFEALGKAILVPNKNSKLVSIELGYFNNPEMFESSGVRIFNLDQYNFCDLIVTGFFYTANNFIDPNGSGLGHPTGINTGFIGQNISGQLSSYISSGYCGGPDVYTQNEYIGSESSHTSYFSRVDLTTYTLIVSGLTSGEADSNFGVYYSGGFSGDQTLISGNLYFAANSAKILSKSIYFESGLNTGIRLFASGWVASGVLKEVYEIPYCVLITSGNSETGSLQAFNDRFGSGYCGSYINTGFTLSRTGDFFYDVINKQTIFVSGLITGGFGLIVTGNTQSGASSTFDSYYASGWSLDYRVLDSGDFIPKYTPSGAVVTKTTFIVNATGSGEISGYQFSGSGYISSGLIIGKTYPYVFETGWISSGMITRGEDFYHRISGNIRKSVSDNLENFIGGFEFNGSGYLLPGATGSGYAQIFAFNVENFDDNINIDLTGDFSGNYNGGFQDFDNGYFVSRSSSKISKFENKHFNYKNLTSFDTQSVAGPSGILGLSAGTTLGEYIYGIPYNNGIVVRYKNTYNPYTKGYTVSGDGTQLKVIFKPEEQITGLIYFASGNTEYNDSGSFNVIKSNKFLVQFFGSEGDEFFEKLDVNSLSGIIPFGALSGNILIVRPDDGDGIMKYY